MQYHSGGLPREVAASASVGFGPALAILLVRQGSLVGLRLRVHTGVTNLGRARYNDLVIPDPTVSAAHARLSLREGIWTLVDLGSSRGTTVDGASLSVGGDAPLAPGTLFRLGEVAFLFDPRDVLAPVSHRLVGQAA